MPLTRDDFRLKPGNFDLGQSHNVVRLLAGAFLLPHASTKFADGGLNAGTIGFFEQVGLEPAGFMVGLAAGAEIVGGLCLLLGLATRWAALGVSAILAVSVFALLRVAPLEWLWNRGGIEYNVFWCLAALAISVTEFKRHGAQAVGASP